MEKEINEKLDELFKILDNDDNIKKIADLKNKISDRELKLINSYRNNPSIENKKKLYENEIINDYLVCENNVNYLIMGINNKFKRSKNCEGNKW
jgi:hypothetical protein